MRLGAIIATAVGALVPTSASAQNPGYDLYVSSRDTHSVKRYDGETGAYLGDFVAPRAGGLGATQQVLVGPGGELLVTGRQTPAILAFHPVTGAFLREFSSGYALDQPTKMTLGPDGLLYVSQWGQTTTVATFDGITGGFAGEATGPLDDPMSHAWNAAGTLHVVSFSSRDVRRFDADGAQLDVLIGPEQLRGPVNLWFEGDDLFVVDWSRGAVRRFDAATGAFEATYVSGMTNAEGWAIGPDDGDLYIADWAQSVVNRYDRATGERVGVFATGGGLSTPNDVMFAPRFPDFSLAVDGVADVIVRPGDDASVAIRVLPDRNLAFDEAVALGCPSLPSGLACRFDPPEVTPGASGGDATLTLSTTSERGGAPVGAAIGLTLVLAGLLATRRPARAALPIALCAALWLHGCGSEDEQTTTTAITVVGAGGDLVHTTTLEVTIVR